jgi:hypothetical protein
MGAAQVAGNSAGAGQLGMGLPNQPPPTLPPAMQASLPPVGQAPLPGTGAVPGGAMRNSPATNPINMYGPISMSGEVNGNAGFGVKNSPVAAKHASLRETVAARYPDLPLDGVMNMLRALGVDRGAAGDNFLRELTKSASNQPTDVDQALLNIFDVYWDMAGGDLQGTDLMRKLAQAPLGNSVLAGPMKAIGVHAGQGGLFGPGPTPKAPLSPAVQNSVDDSVYRSQLVDSLAGKPVPRAALGAGGDVTKGQSIWDYNGHSLQMFANPLQTSGAGKPVPAGAGIAETLNNGQPQPLHGQVQVGPQAEAKLQNSLFKGGMSLHKLSVQQPRKSAAGEGGIPYIIRPHTESGIDALKLERYAYKGRRADSIVPPRYPAGDNGVRTTTSSAS